MNVFLEAAGRLSQRSISNANCIGNVEEVQEKANELNVSLRMALKFMTQKYMTKWMKWSQLL